MFRCVRLILAAGLLAGAVLYGRHLLFFVSSDQAFIDAERVVLRAPIAGRLHLGAIQPGQALACGRAVFRVENSRYGNGEAMSRWAWASEYADRLQLETREAEVLCAQQERIFARYRKLHEQRLISDLEFLEAQTRWASAQSALTNRLTQSRRAELRRDEAHQQLQIQKGATESMPFDGTPWSILIRDGQQVAAHEPIMEVINPDHLWVDALLKEQQASRLEVGSPVAIRSMDGRYVWRGSVQSIRGAGSTVRHESQAVLAAGLWQRPRVAVRVQMASPNPYESEEFYGVGRRVTVTLASHD